ncbi:MAG: phosphatidylserine/phosphatidylglycerophosphate/cardiolipin synthase family protein, partial [Proteobacteria bacterium]
MNKVWTRVKIYHDGDEFFADYLFAIKQAKESVTIESYIFESDSIADRILRELAAAVQRGCSVRLLVDGVGSYFWTKILTARCARDQIPFRVYHPIPGILQWIPRLISVLSVGAPRLFTRTNRRNHRKTLIVDGKIAFLGSFNVTRVHLQSVMAPNAWRDSGV